MRITLTVVDGPHKGKSFSFSGHDTFLVGRSRRAHFQLPAKDKFFSRVHFLIEVNPPSCRIMDMGSRNGTHLNGQKVDMDDLSDGDEIRAGHTVLKVKFEQTAVSPESIVSPAPVSAPPKPAPRAVVPILPSVAPSPFCRACDAPVSSPTVLLCATCQSMAKEQEQIVEGYQVIRIVGQGSMGVVYLAMRQADGIMVALKAVVPAVAGTRAQVERFLREAEILRQLSHPHIVPFRDLGESNGRIYFAMEYVPGRDADQLLRQEGPLKVGRATRLICQLLSALEYAHNAGFVHRDIKPSNMIVTMVNGKEVVKLADFGLARVYQASHLSGLTMTGDVGGTIAFIAPEQITQYREAKPPADQYAAAASLYNLLTGQYIYDLPREISRQLALILNEEPVPILDRRADLPMPLSKVIHKALQRDPGDRYPDARGFLDALKPFAT